MATEEKIDIKWMDPDGVADKEFREYAMPKLRQLEKLLRHTDEVSLRLRERRSLITAEITLFSGALVTRGEEEAGNIRLAFDNAYDRVERQLRRYRDKKQSYRRESIRDGADAIPASHTHPDESGDHNGISPVRVKRFSVKPMSPEEASLQMDLLGHSFFVFRHAETNEVNVVYRRGDGGYGLIETVAD